MINKRLFAFLLTLFTVCCFAFTLTACDKEQTNDTIPPAELIKIDGIAFNDGSFVYDGSEKSITISGELPSGTTVAYEKNTAIDVGSYQATAIISGKGYETLSLTATLTITKATITNISVEENQSIKQDGNYHLPQIAGEIPQGVTVKYFIDGQESQGAKSIGTHTFNIVFSGANYNDLTLSCNLKITIDPIALATSVISSLGSTPDPWNFLPESFSPENRNLTSFPSFDNFYSVANIPQNGIGKQLNVAYGLLNKTEKALSYVQPVYAIANTIKTLYSEFLNNNPDNYKTFTGTVSGITFSLEIDEDEYNLSAFVNNTQVVIYANLTNNSYGAKIQLSTNTILKYTVGNDSLIVAMDILDTSATKIEFVRNDTTTLGYMYEYLVAGDKTITATSTLIQIDDNYTTLIGTKGDFIPTAISRNCEVYSNATGNLVGTEVREELTVSGLTATYNTLWYNLNKISGITTIKKVDKANLPNPDTIYINNASSAILSKTVSVLPTSAKAYSRRFDIEFKTMYFYEYNSVKDEYEQVSCELPMMFVQEEQLSTFESDFSNTNSSYLSSPVSLNVSSADKNAVNYGYYTLLSLYDTIKDLITFESITNYCKN